MGIFPSKEDQFRQWMENFVTACNTHSATLKLAPGELAEIQGASDLFAADINAVVTARAALRTSIVQKDESLGDAQALVRKYNKRFRTTVGVTPQILSALGLPLYDSPTTQSPKQPLGLQAVAYSNGIVAFSFKRSGNPPKCTFFFEVSSDGVDDWQYLAATTKTRVSISGFVPGVRVYVRVYALVNNIRGVASDPVVLYTQDNPMGLMVAA